MSKKQNFDPIWAFPAAVACWDLAQRSPAGDAWEKGDGLATLLVYIAHCGPAGLTRVLKDLDSLAPPAGFVSWAEEAQRFFAASGVSEDLSHLRDRSLFRASPYHVHVATDPEHPMFDPRNLEDVEDGFVTSIDELGEAIHVVLVTLHEDEDGVTRLYSRDGGRRTRGVRLANLRRLSAWYRRVGELSERKAQQLGPPALIRSVDCKAYVAGRREQMVHTIANDARKENSVAKEAVDVWALIRQGYTPAEIARAKAVSEKHIADLLALQKLDASLWAEFCKGRLPAAVGYRLGREASQARQREAWRATEGFRSGKARLEAINQFLTEGTLPSSERRQVIPPRAIVRAVDRLRGTSHGLVVDVLAAVSGDREALTRLPDEVRKALTSHENLKPWARLGLAEVAEVWQAAGVADPKAAKALQEAGLGPSDLDRPATDEILAQAREYGEHTLELGEDELRRILAEGCTIRVLLDNFLLDPQTAALMLQGREHESVPPEPGRRPRTPPCTPPGRSESVPPEAHDSASIKAHNDAPAVAQEARPL